MFFLISKIFAFISNPLAWVIACLLAALLIRDQFKKSFFTWLTIGLFYFFGNIFFIKAARNSWDIPSTPIMQLKTYEMGIVLGGGSRIMLTDTNRVALNWAGDRLVQAVQLYKTGKIKKIVFTGGDASISGKKHPEADNVFKFFKLMDIPDSAIILENQSRNTHENAIFTAKILQERNMLQYPALLVTNGMHMRRSLGCFAKAGIKCDPFSVDDVREYETYSFIYYLIPDQEMFGNWSFMLHEWFGYVTYKIKGYI
jgi:uncharacterized SAM-binding protein YcdF (DUF218 family)